MMDTIFGWLGKNYQWLFSGLGVTMILGLVTWLFRRRGGNQQTQNVGHGSNTKQAGRDIIGEDR